LTRGGRYLPIAIIEAKDNTNPVGAGMQQVLEYAATLDIPFAFSSNGDGFVFHDRTGRMPEVGLEPTRGCPHGILRGAAWRNGRESAHAMRGPSGV
jgi:type I restriction enzyme R subunit